MWEQVARLPEKQRLTIYLYYYQGYDTNEIAQMLDEKPATIRARLAQGRKTLKLRLEEDGYGTTGA